MSWELNTPGLYLVLRLSWHFELTDPSLRVRVLSYALYSKRSLPEMPEFRDWNPYCLCYGCVGVLLFGFIGIISDLSLLPLSSKPPVSSIPSCYGLFNPIFSCQRHVFAGVFISKPWWIRSNPWKKIQKWAHLPSSWAVSPEIGSFQRYVSTFGRKFLRISVSVEVSIFFILLLIFSKFAEDDITNAPKERHWRLASWEKIHFSIPKASFKTKLSVA